MTIDALMIILAAYMTILTTYILYALTGMSKKLSAICSNNIVAHNDMWKRIYGHSHDIKCAHRDCDVELHNVSVPPQSAG